MPRPFRYAFLSLFFFLYGCVTGDSDTSNLSDSANRVLGQPDFKSADNNGGLSAASGSSLSSPQGIFFDGTRLFIADTINNRVLIWSSNPASNNQAADMVLGQGSMTETMPNRGTIATCATLSLPTAVHVNGNRLFVADSGNNRVLVFNNADSLSTGQAADFVMGHANCQETRPNRFNEATNGVNAGTLSNPTSVFYDGRDIFIADTDNFRVLIYRGLPPGHGKDANVVIGQSEMDANAARAVDQNTLNKPQGVTVRDDDLLISDTGNHRVLIFTSIPGSNNASANFVIGQPDFKSASSGTAANRLSNPKQIHGDSGDKLAIADSGNHRVLVYNGIPAQNGVNAKDLIGQDNFTTSSPNRGKEPGSTTLDGPHGVFTNGSIYWIADTLNHRALRF